MAYAAAIGSVVSGVTGALQKSYQGKVAGMNAKIAAQNAVNAELTGGVNAQANDNQTAALIAEQEVAQADSGINISSRSNFFTRASTRALGQADSKNILDDASKEAYNYRQQEASFKAEKKSSKIDVASSLSGGALGAYSNLPEKSMLGGAKSSLASSRFIPKPVLKPFNFNPVSSVRQFRGPR